MAIAGMCEARDAAELLASPVGHYLVGSSFVVWVQTPARIGMFHTGDVLARDDYGSLVGVFALPTSPVLAERYDLLHDIGTIQIFDSMAFEFFEKFLEHRVESIASRVRRLAVVRPRGLAGAAFMGMFQQWVVPRFDARLCMTRGEAYDYLGIAEDERDELDAVSEVRAAPTLRKLRDEVAIDLRNASIERVAARGCRG